MELFKPVQYIVNMPEGVITIKDTPIRSICNGEAIPQKLIDMASPEAIKGLEISWTKGYILKNIYFKTIDSYMSLAYREATRITGKPPNNSVILSKEECGYINDLEIGRFARALQYITALQSIESLKFLIDTAKSVLVENFGRLDPERVRPDKIRDFLDDCDMFLSFRETTILDHKLLGIGQKKSFMGFDPALIGALAASTVV